MRAMPFAFWLMHTIVSRRVLSRRRHIPDRSVITAAPRSQNARGYARHNDVVGDVPNHDGPSSYHGVPSYPLSLNDCRPQPDVAPVADEHTAGQLRPGRNVHVIADHAVVLDERTAVHDDVFTDLRPRVDDRAGHHRSADSDLRCP